MLWDLIAIAAVVVTVTAFIVVMNDWMKRG
jgi:hypothetical protein